MPSSTITPHDFIAKWGPGGPASALNEEQGAQSHFLDLCELLSVPKPGTADDYRFEEKGAVIGGHTGYADVFKRGHFAWENKAPGRNLDVALKQLLTYSLALENPPLLVVCDRLTVRIHTQFTGHPTETHFVRLDQLDQPEKLALLRRLWTDPESFRPKKTTRDITETAGRTCGSGNFLFLALKALKDIEHKTHLDAAALGLDRQQDLVTGPDNVIGLELNEYAAELARVTIWIGELQWRIEHGYPFKTNPVLEPLDHIECRDALLTVRPAPTGGIASYIEASWPNANVVIGPPPFLGDKKMRSELGDAYSTTLRKIYQGRVPGGADLVCYWFEKARKAIETEGLGAAGLVATNSIRGGKNRAVMDALTRTTRIFEAWSDEDWVNEGAAVRVSLIAFGHSTQKAVLNGAETSFIGADLTGPTEGNSVVDLTRAQQLAENAHAAHAAHANPPKF